MKDNIKDIEAGKNVSVDNGNVTIINSGISLAEKEEKKDEIPVTTSESSVQEPTPEVETPITDEIKPDVVVGENNAVNEDVVPIPIPVEAESKEVEAPQIVAPTAEVPIPETPVIPFAPSIEPSVNSFNNDVSQGSNGFDPNVFSGYNVDSSNVNSIANDGPAYDVNQNNINNSDSYYGFGSYNSDANNNVANFDSFTNGYNASSETSDPAFSNTVELLKEQHKSVIDEKIRLEEENNALTNKYEALLKDYNNLKEEYAKSRNEISNIKNSMAAAQSRILDVFGMGSGMIPNNQPVNTFSKNNFGDDQMNNGGMGMAA